MSHHEQSLSDRTWFGTPRHAESAMDQHHDSDNVSQLVSDLSDSIIADDGLTRHHENPTDINVLAPTVGIFAREMVHDLRAVMTQAKTGIDFSQHVGWFVREVAELQHQFANRLARIVDREMVQFAVDNTTDGMQNIREIWLKTVDESRAWATASKAMAVNLERMVEPLQRHQQVSSRKLDQIISENDRLSRPLLAQQTTIVKKQLRCHKVLSPMLHPSFRSAKPKKREQVVGRARTEVVKYVEELNRVNRWIADVTDIARPKMLQVLQVMEEERIERTRRILLRYGVQLRDVSHSMVDVGNSINDRLAHYHVDDDIEQFAEFISRRDHTDREYLSPFTYRLPINLVDLGIDESMLEPPKPSPHIKDDQFRAKSSASERSQSSSNASSDYDYDDV